MLRDSSWRGYENNKEQASVLFYLEFINEFLSYVTFFLSLNIDKCRYNRLRMFVVCVYDLYALKNGDNISTYIIYVYLPILINI